MRDKLIELRPEILSIVISDANTNEAFQNDTLRPILKYQNDLIVSNFKYHMAKYSVSFTGLSDIRKHQLVENLIRKDRKFNELLVGLVIGLFTLDEYEQFIKSEKEYRKRINNMLIQRIQSQVCD